MRNFRDLSVARKLATSAVLGLGLLSSLVGVVAWQGSVAGAEQDAERRANAAQVAAGEAVQHLLSVTDGWLGMLVCVMLTDDPGRLARLKSQFDKRFATRHALDDGLPQRLQGQGYWYSPRFKQLWTTAMASR